MTPPRKGRSDVESFQLFMKYFIKLPEKSSQLNTSSKIFAEKKTLMYSQFFGPVTARGSCTSLVIVGKV